MALGTDYILNALAEEGLRHLFLVPGGLIDPFLPALARQSRLTPIVAAHEAGAVYMADGYARAGGTFGAALGIGGPGCCNMATAIAAAKTDGSPVLVLTGEVPLDMEGRGAFQDASQATLDDSAVMGPLTRLSKTVAEARNLNHWFRHALTVMWAQPRGPVHLSLPHDVLTGECAADYVEVHGYFVGAEPLSQHTPTRHSPRSWSRSVRARGSPFSPAPASSTTRPLRACGRRRNAGRYRSRPRCAPRACFPRTTSCRSACSAMPERAMPPMRSSAASSTASSCSAPASTSATPCTARRCRRARHRPMGQVRPGGDRGAVRILSDVRRDQSGFGIRTTADGGQKANER